jgi:exonuclease V gamma subunit
VISRFSRNSAATELSSFVLHLVLSLSDPAPQRTMVILRHQEHIERVLFDPVRDAERYLAPLLDLFLRARSTPIPLFPRASRAYAAARKKGRSERESLQAAQLEFDGFLGEGSDDHVQLVFGAAASLGGLVTDRWAPSFAEVAMTTFEPLIAHARRER